MESETYLFLSATGKVEPRGCPFRSPRDSVDEREESTVSKDRAAEAVRMRCFTFMTPSENSPIEREGAGKAGSVRYDASRGGEGREEHTH